MGDNMRTAVEKALEELVDVVPAGVDGFYYQGQELKDKKCKEVEAFKGIDTLHKLYAVLRKSWSSSTAYKSCQSEWVSAGIRYNGRGRKCEVYRITHILWSVCNYCNIGI